MGRSRYRNREWSQSNIKRKRDIVCVCAEEGAGPCEWMDVYCMLIVNGSMHMYNSKYKVRAVLANSNLNLNIISYILYLHLFPFFKSNFGITFFSLLSSITEPTQPQGEGQEPPVYEPSQPSHLAPCDDGCDQDKVEQGGIKRVCFKVNEDDQEDSGHDTMSYRDSYR